MKAAVRLGAVVTLWGLAACASGAPAAESRDSGVRPFAPVGGSGSGGGGGSGGAGSGGSMGRGGATGSGGAAGRAGSAGSRPTIPPIVDSGAADTGTDAAPTVSCDDGRKNGMETSADCGGADCGKCTDGKSCVVNDDCESGSCSNAFSCVTPDCDDAQLNQDESDTDCGGAMCAKCGVGKKCNAPADCMSGMCDSAGRCACVPTATCEADECGAKPDGCGAMLMCPMCGDGQRCRNRACECDPGQCDNNCSSFLRPTRCCKSDGTCGCAPIFGNSCE
jgi:hypothetical protein